MSREVAPALREDLAEVLARASAERTPVRIRGAGTASRDGLPVPEPDLVVSTRGLDRILAHEPADLTVTVEAGCRADDLHARLAARGQTWAQPAARPGATVGGLLATAASGMSRLRYGPVRDSVLELVLCTGDGRVVTAGGRTVKGVAGYDLPRLAVGAHGTLGVIIEVTLKLWPLPAHDGWFVRRGTTDALAAEAGRLLHTVVRPAALVLDAGALWLRRAGAAADVVPPDGMSPAGHGPPPVDWTGTVEVGVPPGRVADLAEALAAEGLPFRALPGVGSCAVGVTLPEHVAGVRSLAAALGGHAVVTDGPDALRADPWGPPPPGLAIMRRLRDRFDPAHILNPGRFVGDAAAPPPAAAPGVTSAA